MRTSLGMVALLIGSLVGCGSDPVDTGKGPGPGPGEGDLAGDVTSDLSLSGDVTMTATATILPDVTVTLAAGTILHASAGTALVIQGTLMAEGTTDKPVVLQSEAHDGADGWVGLDAMQGGNVMLNNVAIHDATVAFRAQAGSTYAIDHILVDTSSALADLASDGTITHGQLHSLGPDQINQPIQITSASPIITDTLVDQGNTGVDLINVDGMSSGPQFDHLEVTGCHCAFHFNAGSGITISNSYVHDNEYGIMVVSAVEIAVQDSNFESNGVNIGICAGGNVVSTGVYFTGEAYDSSCMGQGNVSPAGMPVSGVGPRP